MRLKLILLTCFLLILGSLQAQKGRSFRIAFIQNGKKIKIKDRVVRLKKEEFRIKFTMKKDGIVYLQPLIDSVYYNWSADKSIDYIEQIGGHVYAEYPKNKGRDIFVDNERPYGLHYLQILSESDNRGFDEVEVKRRKKIGWRTVSSIFFMQNFDDRKNIALKDFKQDLYLMFLSLDFTEKKAKEHQRKCIKIVWEE